MRFVFDVLVTAPNRHGGKMVGRVFSIRFAIGDTTRSARKNTPAPALAEYIGGVENSLVPVALETMFQEQPKFNPIAFFGPAGTGKSLLVQLIAARWKHENRAARLVVTTGADFAREYARALETDSVPDLRLKYRRASLVAIDDLHEIGEKTAAQNELVQTLDALLVRHQRVVVTLAQSPADTTVLLPTLAGRLAAGLTVPLHPPGPAARRLILRALASARNLSLPDRVIELVASDALSDALKPGTVPRLLQTLLRLEQLPFDSDTPINEQDLRRCLQSPDEDDEPQLHFITKRVSRYFNLRTSDLKSKTRQQRVVRARGVAMFLARQLTANSLETVGRHFGNRDHTTVLHACRKTEALLELDPSIRQAVEDLKTELTAT